MKLNIYRNNALLLATKANATLSEKLHGEYKITAQIPAPDVLQLQIGDYTEHRGETFTLNAIPDVNQSSNMRFDHTVIFEASVYELGRKMLRDEGARKFNYFGTPNDFLLLLITNMQEVDNNWQIGSVDTAEPKNIYFEGLDCRQALTKIAEEFKFEYIVKNKIIYLKQSVGNNTAITFSYGKENGAYNISRKHIDNTKLVTKLYLYGGEKKLEYSYKNGSRQLTTTPAFITKNTELYGVIEGDFEDPEIYPHRTGTISAVVNDTAVVDSSLNFNINHHLLSGEAAKIVFKSGDLAGNEFEIYGYDDNSKKILFNPIKEANDYTLPNDVRKPKFGDTYTLTGIKMPQTYIDAAEEELLQKGQEYLNQYAHPQTAYDIKPAKFWMRKNNYELHAGDRVQLISDKLAVNRLIRITDISYPLADPYDVQLTISDQITYNRQTATEINTIRNKQEIAAVSVQSVEAARQEAARLRNLKDYIFNPDGTYNTSHFGANTIDTQMLNVGATSQNFVLRNALINLNISGNPNIVRVTAGDLVHFSLEIPGIGYTWQIPYKQLTGLDSTTAYYLYARCSKTQLTGTWEINTNQKKVDSEAGFHWFLIGVIYPVKDGLRSMDNLFGNASIVGDRITAGRIQSLDGENFFDLNTGVLQSVNALIKGKIESLEGKIGKLIIDVNGLKTANDSVTINDSGLITKNSGVILNENGITAITGTIAEFLIDQYGLKVGDVYNYSANSIAMKLTKQLLNMWSKDKFNYTNQFTVNTELLNIASTAYISRNSYNNTDNNVALTLSADNGQLNYALMIYNGDVRFLKIKNATNASTTYYGDLRIHPGTDGRKYLVLV